MNKNRIGELVIRALFVSVSLNFAQVAIAQGIPTPPGGVPVGPLIAYPGVDVAIGHNDILFLTNNNTRSSSLTVISPYIKLEGTPGPHKFDVGFRYDDGRFSNSSADNYGDSVLNANGNFVFTGRAALKVRAEHRFGHDPRGSTDRVGAATPDEYLNQGVGGVFSYGAPGAQGRIEVDGSTFSREYQNNRTTTAQADRDTNTLGGTFFWRVAPKTELLFSAQQSDIDYDLSTSTQDSTERRYIVGAKWEATALTTGIFRIGRQTKKFDSGGRTDFSGSAWDAAVRWSPLTYSVFDFTTSKSTGEATGTGDLLLTSGYGVTWNHAWNSRFSSAVNGSWKKDEFLGTGGGREDKTGALGAKLTYQMQRWLRFSGEYVRTDRDSNNNTFEYKKNLWMFTVGATL